MAVNSTYSVYKSSKLPSREQKITWHFSRFHFIGICSCAGKILVTEEELITEALNDSQDYCLTWQKISSSTGEACLWKCAWVDCSVLFHNGTFACRYVLCSQTSGEGTITEGS